ncbi:hypothetical protein BD309DRAFT_485097 [Dichomitus squalens]|nr:hypothetical protein BD309DRAFT_485097 [Dichomitus squalens]
MEDLPVELLQPICLYSCTDGGFTGSSLSLVSRHFQDISRTRSISCPPVLVRHLCLASSVSPSADNLPSAIRTINLMKLLGSELHTLAFINRSYGEALGVACPESEPKIFPLLRELTLANCIICYGFSSKPPSVGDEDAMNRSRMEMFYPSLTHFHAAPPVPEIDVNEWAKTMPALTHVRISIPWPLDIVPHLHRVFDLMSRRTSNRPGA